MCTLVARAELCLVVLVFYYFEAHVPIYKENVQIITQIYKYS